MSNYYDDSIPDDGLQGLVDKVAAGAGNVKCVLCSAQPTTRAEALALHDGTSGKYRVSDEMDLGVGDATLGDRAGGGREVTIAAAAAAGNIAATVSGQDLHWAFYDATTLLAVLQETSDQAVTAGNSFNRPALKIGYADPA